MGHRNSRCQRSKRARQTRREAEFALPPWLWYTGHPSHIAFRWNRTGHKCYQKDRQP